mmetsp:Transcript_38459/g.96748  ORF Transcript_38459/g.96748 Transcript_38459/m.96748 type:complete len:575 (+) Transcript_38459:667-2391(+)
MEVGVVILLKIDYLHAVRRLFQFLTWWQRSQQIFHGDISGFFLFLLTFQLFIIGCDLLLLGNKLRHLGMRGDVLNFVMAQGQLDSKAKGVQLCSGFNEGKVQFIVDIEFEWSWCLLRACPERLTTLSNHILGEHEQQLLDAIHKEILELVTSPFYSRLLSNSANQLGNFLNMTQCSQLRRSVLTTQCVQKVVLLNVGVKVGCRLDQIRVEKALACPHQCVCDGVRKVVHRAERNRGLGWISSRRVALRNVRQHDLHVALGAQRAGLEQRLAVQHTLAVHVAACLHVIERVAHSVQRVVEGSVEEALGLGTDAQRQRLHVHGRVHPSHLLTGRLTLQLAEVALTEEELTVQVALLDGVQIGDVHQALCAGGNAHHGPVLDHLAADRSGAHQEVAQVLHSLLQLPTDHGDLRVVAAATRSELLHAEIGGVLGQHLNGVKVHPLMQRGELARARLQRLLRHNTAHHRRHRANVAARALRQRAHHRFVGALHVVGLRGHRLGEVNHLVGVRLVAGHWCAFLLCLELPERLQCDVNLLAATKLGQIDLQRGRILERILQWHKVHQLWLLDLTHVAGSGW